VIAAVAAETIGAIDRIAPGQWTTAMEIRPLPPEEVVSHQIMATADGYIESIDYEAFDEFAETHGVTVRIERGMGDFVARGTPIARLTGNVAGDAARGLERAVSIGRHRTVEQDIGFGIRQLVDIALRALSPGINDTTTAVMCINYLTSILARLATRPIPDFEQPAYRSARVIEMRPVTFQGLLRSAFDQIRESGRDNSAIVQALADSADLLTSLVTNDARRDLLRGRQLFQSSGVS
jgi:uncharacterized membrane protein